MCLVGLALSGAGPTGTIAFVSGTEQEDHCVCVLDVATRTVQPVGRGARDGAPVWSPDGAWIAFESVGPDGLGIFVVKADGTGARGLKHAAHWNRSPRWSSDGSKLAYTGGEGFQATVRVYDLETDTETEWGGGRAGLMRPVWLDLPRTGDWLGVPLLAEAAGGSNRVLLAIGLTQQERGLSSDILFVTRDDAQPIPVQALPSDGTYFEWAVEQHPRGKTIAFESNDGGDREIFVLSFTRGTFDLTNHRAADWNPVWSPDGKWIAFESFRGGRRGVYRVFASTTRVEPIAQAPEADNWAPTWAPDGKWVAFVSDRTGNPELFIVEIESGDEVRLTDHVGDDLAPAFRPEGR